MKRVLNPEAVTFLSGFLSVCWDFSHFMGSCEREAQRLGLDTDYLKELLEGIKLKMCNKIGFSGSTFQTELRMGCSRQVFLLSPVTEKGFSRIRTTVLLWI